MSFEGFVRRVHAVIGEVGCEAAYVFDSISYLAEAWLSDHAMADFFSTHMPEIAGVTHIGIFWRKAGLSSAQCH